MRGSCKRRENGTWRVIVDIGYVTYPDSGKRKRRQKWETVRGTRKQAEARLTELLREIDRGEFINSSKLTLGEWLQTWLVENAKSSVRPSTYTAYCRIVRQHLTPILGSTLLQALRPGHVKQYYLAKS